jgi:hypothetical protein
MEIMTMVATTTHREVELPYDVPGERLGNEHIARNEGSPQNYEVNSLFEESDKSLEKLVRQNQPDRSGQIAVAATVSIEQRLEAFAA